MQLTEQQLAEGKGGWGFKLYRIDTDYYLLTYLIIQGDGKGGRRTVEKEKYMTLEQLRKYNKEKTKHRGSFNLPELLFNADNF